MFVGGGKFKSGKISFLGNIPHIVVVLLFGQVTNKLKYGGNLIDTVPYLMVFL